MRANTSAIPDLLRRFVGTPYAVSFVSGEATIRIESNEFAIVNKLHGAMVVQQGFETELSTWKLIRDEAAPCDEKELTLMSAGALTLLMSGTGTVIAVDRDRREVLGFLAPNVSADEFVTALLPIILKLSQQGVAATSVETGQAR